MMGFRLVLSLAVLATTLSVASSLPNAIAYRGQFPWQASLFKKTTFAGSGALVTQTLILTTSSAVVGKQLEAVLGSLSLSTDTTQRIKIARTMIHELWDSDTAENDIALLELSRAPILDDYISTIRLPLSLAKTATFVGQTLTVGGWGNASPAEELSLSNVEVIRNADCQPGEKLPFTKMCAKGLEASCRVENGDPVVFMEADGQYTLVGVVTSDLHCDPQQPTTITRVSMFMDWMSENGVEIKPDDDRL